ncbi:CD48 antigen-like isoform X1 [Falco rusticolus]|uniref:CD48 antigen isoform X1 n=2 Tax=Falco TaxID=8952 RepID=UPI0006B6FD9D|nr:CD48 antigen isoform X1 [Falco cherrug]XP_037226982.1 CD48 antigen-like isoform X1 [Falco rusticolus]
MVAGATGSGWGSLVGGCLVRGISDSPPGVRCGHREKMAARLTTALLFIMQAAGVRQGWSSEVVGAVHGVVYLSPSLQNQTYHQIQWRRDNVMKIASRDGSAPVQYPNTPYKGRLELFPNNTLKISSLQETDSSTYQVYLEDVEGKEHIENILLTVYDLVPKPTVNVEVIGDEPVLCEAILKCSVGLEGVTYEWERSKKVPLDAGGSVLHVSFNPSLETYTCKASNPVSSNSTSLTYRHPCSWIGESSSAASCTTTSVLMALGYFVLLLFLLPLD